MAKLYKLVLMLMFLLLVMGIQSAWAEWVPDGVAICAADSSQNHPCLTSDGSGGAIIAWQGFRDGNYDIYSQRVDALGNVLWTVNGVAICASTDYKDVCQLVSDGAGGAIIVWEDARGIYAQRVNANGSILWTANGVAICSDSEPLYLPQLVSDGAGGAIITWNSYSGGNRDIYAQRVDANGSVLWTADGVAICTATDYQWFPELASDGAGGAIITWRDKRSGNYDIYAQKVDASGSVLWTENGVAVCTATRDQWTPNLVSDGAGGAVIAWQNSRSGSAYDIYAQRVNASGNALWAANGVVICTTTWGTGVTNLVSDGAGGAIITWSDNRSGSNSDIYSQRVNANGSVLWTTNGVVCTATGSQIAPNLVSDGASGAVITWADYRSGSNYDIYAQRVNANGNALWTTDGVAMCTDPDDQVLPYSISDGSGGAIVVWNDSRITHDVAICDIYAQRVDAAGHVAPEVATLLQNYAATFSKAGIALTWTLSEVDEDVEFFIERSMTSSGPFTDLSSNGLIRDGLSFSFIDRNWEPNMSYWYRVEYSAGSEHKTLFESGPVTTPAMPLMLHQNSPNPFNPSTEIRYYLPEKCSVGLDIYDVNGALVTQVVESYQDKGTHTVSWDGRDRNGRQVSSGVYFYRLKAGKTEISKKMVLTR